MATTLLDLKQGAANILEEDVASLTVNGQDLFLLAANQARKTGELANDFEFSRKLVTVSVNGATGGSLGDAEDSDGDPIDVKTVIDAGLEDNNGNLIPVSWTTVAESLEGQRQSNSFGVARYPRDGDTLTPNGGPRFNFSGDSIYRWPRVSVTDAVDYPLYLEVYSFFPDWTPDDLEDSSVSDIWTTKGGQYILWQTIVHLNKRFKYFVARQEGNLPPPNDLADAGLQTLIEWDANRFELFRRHNR